MIVTSISNGHDSADCSTAPIDHDGKIIDTSPLNSPNGISGDIDNIKNSATTDSTV